MGALFLFCFFFDRQFKHLWPHLVLLPLNSVLPLLSNHSSTWLFPGWVLPTVDLENLRLYLEQSSLPRDASGLGS